MELCTKYNPFLGLRQKYSSLVSISCLSKIVSVFSSALANPACHYHCHHCHYHYATYQKCPVYSCHMFHPKNSPGSLFSFLKIDLTSLYVHQTIWCYKRVAEQWSLCKQVSTCTALFNYRAIMVIFSDGFSDDCINDATGIRKAVQFYDGRFLTEKMFTLLFRALFSGSYSCTLHKTMVSFGELW